MRYRHAFHIRTSLPEVVEFHRRAESLKAITPPGLPMQFLETPPEELSDGDTLVFRCWVGPVPVVWKARIESAPPSSQGAPDGPAGHRRPNPVAGEQGFFDRQLEGPFRHWVHHHRFLPGGEGGTWIVDEIEARLRPHPLWGPVGIAMWVGLPLLFAFRGWKTRRLLEQSGVGG